MQKRSRGGCAARRGLGRAIPGSRRALFALTVLACTGTANAQVDFTDVAAAAGLSRDTYVTANGHGLGVNWIDYDRDGWPDLFAVNGRDAGGAHLYRNEGNGSFSDQDHLLPVLPNVQMMGSVYADYDNDGDSDIYIFTDNAGGAVGPTAAPPNILLQNQWVENGGQIVPGEPLFVDVAVAAGVDDLLDTALPDGPAYRTATGGWLDYDRDGNVDLYVCHWDRQNFGSETNKDRLYRNLGDGTFEDVTDSSGIIPVDDGTYFRACLAFIGAHLDDDLWPDIYVGNVDGPLPWSGDLLLQNDGGMGFVDRTADSPGLGDDAEAAMGITVGDVDLNGSPDIYLSDLGGGVLPAGNPLYMHTGSDIVYGDNVANVAGVTAIGSWGVNFLDVNHDGYEDLFVATMSETKSNILYINDPTTGTFTEHSEGLGINLGRGSAYADYDRDGDLDIAVVGRDSTLQLHRNDSAGQGHWLQLHLISNDSGAGMTSNGDAIGTLVRVTVDGQTYVRQIIGGDSGHGQNSLGLHFGLGAATEIDTIEVLWPSGAVFAANTQPVDTFMAVHEQGANIALVSPKPGTDVTSSMTTFQRMTGGSVPIDAWSLTAGTSSGASDLFDSGSLSAAEFSVEASGLPTDGSLVFVRLSYELDGRDYHVDYRYGSSSAPPPPPPPPPPGTPAMSTPIPGSVLSGNSETFTWSANGEAVDRWQLRIGSTPGGRDIFVQQTDGSVVSLGVDGLPTDGSTVYVQLRWRANGVISTADYVYTAANDGTPPPPPQATPGITTPVPGSVLSGSTETFNWSANGEAVDRWQLRVGTTPGGRDIFVQQADGSVVSLEVNGLPSDGSAIYVTLRWRINGVVSGADYSYTAAGGT